MQFEMNKFLKFGYLKLFLVLILFEPDVLFSYLTIPFMHSILFVI